MVKFEYCDHALCLTVPNYLHYHSTRLPTLLPHDYETRVGIWKIRHVQCCTPFFLHKEPNLRYVAQIVHNLLIFEGLNVWQISNLNPTLPWLSTKGAKCCNCGGEHEA